MLLCDVAADDIARYQAERLEKGAAPKTVNLEVGTLRAILRKNRLWASIQPDVRMLRAREDVGRAISRDEEDALLDACKPLPITISRRPNCTQYLHALLRDSPSPMGAS